MLSYNVAALLRSAPGTARRYPVDAVDLPIADDLRLAAPIDGEVRLSRTGRSILARASLTTAIEEHVQPLPDGRRGARSTSSSRRRRCRRSTSTPACRSTRPPSRTRCAWTTTTSST